MNSYFAVTHCKIQNFKKIVGSNKEVICESEGSIAKDHTAFSFNKPCATLFSPARRKSPETSEVKFQKLLENTDLD